MALGKAAVELLKLGVGHLGNLGANFGSGACRAYHGGHGLLGRLLTLMN